MSRSNQNYHFIRFSRNNGNIVGKALDTGYSFIVTLPAYVTLLLFTRNVEAFKNPVFGKLNEPPHDKTNKMTVRPAKTQIRDQRGHPPSLISLRCALNR